MSWVFETFKSPNGVFVEYLWDKYNGYEMVVGTYDKERHMVCNTKYYIYASEEQARKAFKRKVARVKREEAA